MKVSIGTPTQTYGVVLPHLKKLLAITSVSRSAKQRLKWIDAYLRWGNARKVCRHFGISSRTFYRWYGRWQRLGICGLADQSRRPKRVRQSSIPWPTIALVERLRQANPAWSKYKIAEILKRDHGTALSPSTVNRIFHRRSLFWPSPMTKHRQAIRRWQIERKRAPLGLKGVSPGSLVEIDVKYLSVFSKTVYQFTAIDTCTRLKFIRIYSGRTAGCGERFIDALLNFFPFTIHHIQSDNGSEFLAECHAYLTKQGITHYFSKVKQPKQQGHVERTIQSDESEYWLWGNLTDTIEGLNRKADEWLTKWNTYRPHQALKYMTPMTYYQLNFASA